MTLTDTRNTSASGEGLEPFCTVVGNNPERPRYVYVLVATSGNVVGYYSTKGAAMEDGVEDASDEFGNKYLGRRIWTLAMGTAHPAIQRLRVGRQNYTNAWFLHVGLDSQTMGDYYIGEFEVRE